MMSLLLLQVGLPVAVLAWLLLRPSTSAAGLTAQIAAAVTVSLALVLAGLWLFPPWWTPYVYLGAAAAAGTRAWRRRPPQLKSLPSSPLEWAGTAALAALTLYSGQIAVQALAGRRPPSPVINLAFPLAGGPYLVVNGGSTEAVNAHLLTLDPGRPGFRGYRGQSYAVDIIKLNRWGASSDGVQPRSPKAYAIYGQPVSAPCAGTVIDAIDGVADMPVPLQDRRNMTGNSVRLRCGGVEVLLAHLVPGSVEVRPGARVGVGHRLGVVGNSGNSATPHLHIHAQRRSPTADPIAGDPVGITLGGRYLVRNDRVSGPGQAARVDR